MPVNKDNRNNQTWYLCEEFTEMFSYFCRFVCGTLWVGGVGSGVKCWASGAEGFMVGTAEKSLDSMSRAVVSSIDA